MKILKITLFVVSAIFVSGCVTQQIEPASPDHAQSQSVPDMPSWVTFVRFSPPVPSANTAITAHIDNESIDEEPAEEPEEVTGVIPSTPKKHRIYLKDDANKAQKGEAINVNQTAYAPGTNYLTSSTLNDEEWFFSQKRSHYTVQLVSMRKDSSVQNYLKEINAVTAKRYTVLKNNNLWHIAILGKFSTFDQAKVIADNYPDSWVRRFEVLQSRRCKGVTRLPLPISENIQAQCHG